MRYQAGTTPTNYTYTGQYSYTADFGLMFYNARWYDPSLGRFAQADTIVPGGVQGYDRYAYVNNSPVSYADPSGHKIVCDEGYFGSCNNTGIGEHDGSNARTANSQSKKTTVCDVLPIICRGDSPINYDTIEVSGDFGLKFIGGIEIQPSIWINGQKFRDFEWDQMDAAIGYKINATVGVSAEAIGGLDVTGSKGSVPENMVGASEPYYNLGGCLILCIGNSKPLSSIGQNSANSTSKSFKIGSDIGFDASVGVSASDFVVYGDQSRNVGVWHIPVSLWMSPFSLPNTKTP